MLSRANKPQTHSSQRKIARRKVVLKVGEVVYGLSSWLSVRPSSSLMLARVRALRGRPLPRCRSILPVMSVFLIKVFTPSTFHCLSAETSYTNVWLSNPADLQANQMSIFNGKTRGKTHYLQTCKYDVRMTSSVAMKMKLLHRSNF